MRNTNAITVIDNSLQREKVFHSYIFVKDGYHSENAIYLAKKLLDTTTRIDEHSSVIYIDGSENMILKKDIVGAMDSLQMTSTHDGNRILFIKGVENGNKSSLNAMLKTIEEPGKNIYVIMTSSNINKVIPTIVSRSQIIFDSTSEIGHSPDILREAGIDEKWILFYGQINSRISDVIDLFNSSFHKTLATTIDLLTKSLDNKSFITGPLGQIITKNNYTQILNILDQFYNDIWKVQQGIAPVFQMCLSSITAYASSSFEYQKALQIIINFLESMDINVNFSLAKANMLVKLEAVYG